MVDEMCLGRRPPSEVSKLRLPDYGNLKVQLYEDLEAHQIH
jgi:hypothetical protein